MLEYTLINILWVIGFIYLNRKLRNGFHILQLEHYKIKAYKEWMKKHASKVWDLKELILFIPIVIAIFSASVQHGVGESQLYSHGHVYYLIYYIKKTKKKKHL